MPLMAQGWTKRADGSPVVAALVVSKAAGWGGWELHTGSYDPSKGETINTVAWEFRCAGHLMSIIQVDVLGELMSWQESNGIQDLTAALKASVEIARSLGAS